MSTKNPHAVSLGKLAKGKKKTLTDEQREDRKKMMAHARKSRWPNTRTPKPGMDWHDKP